MDKKSKAKWQRKECGCVKTTLSIGPAIIHCEKHRGKPTKGGRAALFIDGDGMVRPRGYVKPQDLQGEEQVYFAQLGDLIKIGISADPVRRAYELNATLLGSIRGDRETEKKMHRKFADLRHHREWFRAEAELLEWIEELPA